MTWPTAPHRTHSLTFAPAGSFGSLARALGVSIGTPHFLKARRVTSNAALDAPCRFL